MDWRLLSFAVWGFGTMVLYGIVVSDRYGDWQRWHDHRSLRDLIEAAGLFMVSIACAGSVAMVLFGVPGSPVRGALIALALGGFTGVGILMVSDIRDRRDREDDQ